jgi:hypothetical protein
VTDLHLGTGTLILEAQFYRKSINHTAGPMLGKTAFNALLALLQLAVKLFRPRRSSGYNGGLPRDAQVHELLAPSGCRFAPSLIVAHWCAANQSATAH